MRPGLQDTALNAPVTVDSLAPRDEPEVPGDPQSSAVVVGQIGNDQTVSGLLVEFDHDGDGIADGTAYSAGDGSFEYTPTGSPRAA